MAIRLITGQPGCGKSYYMLCHLVKHYCTRLADTYQLNPEFVLVTNIDGLLLDHIDLNQAIEKSGGVTRFFTVEVQKAIFEKYKEQKKRVLYVIDEAQDYFDRRFYERGVFRFFEYHRHFGYDIFLMSQDRNLMAPGITQLAEKEMRGVPRTISFFGHQYVVIINRQIVSREIRKPDKSIYRLYRSAFADENEKTTHPLRKHAAVVAVLSVLAIIFFKYTVYDKFTGSETEAIAQQVTKPPQPAFTSFDTSSKPSPVVHRRAPVVAAAPALTGYPLNHASTLSHGLTRIYVVDPFSNELVPLSYVKFKTKVVMQGRRVKHVYALLTPEELQTVERRARATADPGPGYLDRYPGPGSALNVTKM